MSKRNLYPAISTKENYGQSKVRTMMNAISYCDNNHFLLEIAEKIKIPIWYIYEHMEKLVENYMISEV
jgi:aminopeptidase-like protein